MVSSLFLEMDYYMRSVNDYTVVNVVIVKYDLLNYILSDEITKVLDY